MKVATKSHVTRAKKVKRVTLASLQEEVRVLRSAVIGFMSQDDEGEYRPEFIERIKKASKEKPVHVFKDAKSFLALLKKV